MQRQGRTCSRARLAFVVLLLVVGLVFSRECVYILIREVTCGQRHDGTEGRHEGGYL